jgi:transcriptional regulator with XRE-family HTH domain
MNLSALHSPDALLKELGRRVERLRLARNLSQEALAERAGIGRATMQRIARGEPVKTTALIKVLGALDRLDALDAALPERVQSPLAELERQRPTQRQRASAPRAGAEEQWTWGEGE